MKVAQVNITLTSHHDDEAFNERAFSLNHKSKPSIEIGRSSKRHSIRGFPAASNATFSSPVISRKHAELFVLDGDHSVYIKDLESLHGTSVNFEALGEGEERPLVSGDIIIIGGVKNDNRVSMARKFEINYDWEDVYVDTPWRNESIELQHKNTDVIHVQTKLPESTIFRVPDLSSSESDHDDFSKRSNNNPTREKRRLDKEPGSSPHDPYVIEDDSISKENNGAKANENHDSVDDQGILDEDLEAIERSSPLLTAEVQASRCSQTLGTSPRTAVTPRQTFRESQHSGRPNQESYSRQYSKHSPSPHHSLYDDIEDYQYDRQSPPRVSSNQQVSKPSEPLEDQDEESYRSSESDDYESYDDSFSESGGLSEHSFEEPFEEEGNLICPECDDYVYYDANIVDCEDCNTTLHTACAEAVDIGCDLCSRCDLVRGTKKVAQTSTESRGIPIEVQSASANANALVEELKEKTPSANLGDGKVPGHVSFVDSPARPSVYDPTFSSYYNDTARTPSTAFDPSRGRQENPWTFPQCNTQEPLPTTTTAVPTYHGYSANPWSAPRSNLTSPYNAGVGQSELDWPEKLFNAKPAYIYQPDTLHPYSDFAPRLPSLAGSSTLPKHQPNSLAGYSSDDRNLPSFADVIQDAVLDMEPPASEAVTLPSADATWTYPEHVEAITPVNQSASKLTIESLMTPPPTTTRFEKPDAVEVGTKRKVDYESMLSVEEFRELLGNSANEVISGAVSGPNYPQEQASDVAIAAPTFDIEANDTIQPPAKKLKTTTTSTATMTTPKATKLKKNPRSTTTSSFLLGALAGGVGVLGALIALPESMF